MVTPNERKHPTESLLRRSGLRTSDQYRRVNGEHLELTLRPREVVVAVVVDLAGVLLAIGLAGVLFAVDLAGVLLAVVRTAGGFLAAALALVTVVVPVTACARE